MQIASVENHVVGVPTGPDISPGWVRIIRKERPRVFEGRYRRRTVSSRESDEREKEKERRKEAAFEMQG